MRPDRPTPARAPYGAWTSPITAARLARDVIQIREIATRGDAVAWIESRPAEQGRSVIVVWERARGARDVLLPPFDAATRVHEYGGGALAWAGEDIVFSNAIDQRLYRTGQGRDPVPLTRAAPWRFADGRFDAPRHRMVAVRERHDHPSAPINDIVAIDLTRETVPRVLLEGADFYASPRPSLDGRRLAWVCWNRPSMPWIGSELWVATIAADGGLEDAMRVAGGPDESVCQPEWSPSGVLHFVSDRRGWWNVYRWTGTVAEPVTRQDAEFGQPPWEFGLSNYAFLADGAIVCSYAVQGTWTLARLDPGSGRLDDLSLPYTDVTHVCAAGSRAAVRAASPAEPFSVVLIDPQGSPPEVLRRSVDAPEWAPYYSTATPLDVVVGGDRRTHAFFFPPRNPDFDGPPGERPPLLVRCHGGPTFAASPALDPRVQYWTSAGFAVVLVNYTGSSGYGRAYRQALAGRWGEIDLDDVAAVVRMVGARDLADADRVAIAGQSAGGYLALRAVTRTAMFRAAVSYYGVADLDTLHRTTHKFEQHYIEWLVGAPPDAAAVYRSRSPLHDADRVSAPVLFVQGAEDPIAAPAQGLDMLRALRARGVPAAGLLFTGERHGLEREESVRRALEAESLLYAMTLVRGALRL